MFDIEQLKAMLIAKDALLQAKEEEVAALKPQVQLLVEQLNPSKSKRFASQSEKVAKGTFNEAEQQDALPSAPKARRKTGRKPLPADLEREVQTHTLNAPYCDGCDAPLHECGKEVSETLKILPQRVSVIRHERTKYACRQCEQTAETSKVVTAKYVDALPLYRQVDILNRSGIDISRATLANWCVQLGSKVQVIVDAMKTQLLKETLICADETTVQVLREEDRQAQSNSYMWVYRSGEFTPNPVVIYDYHPSRAGACVREFLGDYHGYLLSDGYSGYDTVEGITQAGCMAHVRRKFTDAQKASPSKKAGKPEKALTFIAKLYGIEKRAKDLSPEARQQMRMQESLPILNDFKAWLDSLHILPKGALGQAITYTKNQWTKLLTYLEDGHISIDNNVTERDISPFTTGRKNWMFSTSVGGAKGSANLYSLVMTCRANDINPYYYFRHLFTELPKRSVVDDMSDLMPWNVDLSGIE
ncbi:IS66 family transposase [Grimontia hollisae]|uniref:IS66 family transposase n=1 Tax=Grimontia hollisae TaxID=673 RepID=UPI0013031FDC|nr:IS66 family transposase [Grimontia hollisae]